MTGPEVAGDNLSRAILDFWFLPPTSPDHGSPRKAWFEKNPDFDAEITERFLGTYEDAAKGVSVLSPDGPETALALIILLDQMTRNMFRDTPRMYESDDRALAIAKEAIEKGFDTALPPVMQKFFYLPFEHAEDLAEQERSMALFGATGDQDSLKWAKAHHDIIARFGRFPHRNAILGRESTQDELEFLKQPGSSF